MYIQKIVTILMDDEIHDLILGDDGEQRPLQEYIFIDEPSDLDDLLKKLWQIYEDGLNDDTEHLYIKETAREIKEAIALLEKEEVDSVVFVYQN